MPVVHTDGPKRLNQACHRAHVDMCQFSTPQPNASIVLRKAPKTRICWKSGPRTQKRPRPLCVLWALTVYYCLSCLLLPICLSQCLLAVLKCLLASLGICYSPFTSIYVMVCVIALLELGVF